MKFVMINALMFVSGQPFWIDFKIAMHKSVKHYDMSQCIKALIIITILYAIMYESVEHYDNMSLSIKVLNIMTICHYAYKC
jgi:hypothetical protein